jgi:monofunctional biosynthetic peptidoglycan transglycosylase
VFATKILVAASLLRIFSPTASADPLELDFDNQRGEWRVVVDGVMGGRSTGRVARTDPGVLEFSGDLSLENNGGFSQMRCDVSGNQFAGMLGIEITVRGDGREYKFDIRCSNARVMAGGFQRAFATKDGEWTNIRMPFDEFRLYSFGRRAAGAPTIMPSLIESIGVTLSDKMEGPFRLDIASIRVYGEESNPGQSETSDLASLPRFSTLDGLRDLIDADQRVRAPQTVSAMASAEAVRLTELAIKRGVPLFNAGQETACAAIYEVTIEALVALGQDDLGRSVVQRLEKGLDESKTDSTAAERAWTYRRALDDAYRQLVGGAGRERRVASH